MNDLGFLVVDKPQGWTSHDVVAKLRGTLGIKRVGHAGTLDPMATGVVVVAVGRATRLIRFVQELPKVYEATAMFGVATDSLDADGAILDRTPMSIERADVEGLVSRFTGPIMQVPPMVSALKSGGRRLYEIAREGGEVERDPRPAMIYELSITEFAPGPFPEVSFRVRCGKGTYVRSLADDMAAALGGRAHLTSLRRTAIGSLTEEMAIAPDDPEPHLISTAEALGDMAVHVASDDVAEAVSHGVAIAPFNNDAIEDGAVVRIVDTSGNLMAIYQKRGRTAVAEVVLG